MSEFYIPEDSENADDRQLLQFQPETMQDVIELYGDIKNEPVVATKDIIKAIETLKTLRGTMAYLEEQEKRLKDKIACHMLDKAQLITDDGEVIATWAMSSSSKRFNEKAFRAEHGELYQKYIEEREGNRRFLIK